MSVVSAPPPWKLFPLCSDDLTSPRPACRLLTAVFLRCVTFDISEWAAGPHPQAGHPVSLSLHWSIWRAEIQALTSCYTPARSLWSSADGSLGRTPNRFGGSNMDRVVLGKIGKSPWCCSAFPRTSLLHFYGINALKKHLKNSPKSSHTAAYSVCTDLSCIRTYMLMILWPNGTPLYGWAFSFS